MRINFYIASILMGIALLFAGDLYSQTTPSKFQIRRMTGVPNKAPEKAAPSPLRSFTPQKAINLSQSTTQAKDASSNRIIHRDKKNGRPIYIKSLTPISTRSIPQNREEVLAVTMDHLAGLRDITGINDPTEEYKAIRVQEDKLGHRHVKLNQMHDGLEIYGGEIAVHLDPAGKTTVNGHFVTNPNRKAVPVLDVETAIELTIRDLKQHTFYRDLSEAEKNLLSYQKPLSELLWFPDRKNPDEVHLAYHLTIRPNFVQRFEYYVDAENGEILNYFDHTCFIGPATAEGTHLNGTDFTINVFDDGSIFRMYDISKSMFKGNPNSPQAGDGIIVTLDMQNNSTNNIEYVEITSQNNTWDQIALSAHVNASISYDYFLNTFNWNSINGEGGDIISLINVADENGKGFDNAFWNGAAMFYGNGDFAFTPLAGSIDVGGHEMAHGVIQSTANLEYQDESGALNESFADVFAVLIDREDFLLGEDVVNPSVFQSGALRDMANPNNGGSSLADNGYQPDNVADQFRGTEDNGGVHINSGIPNKAFHLFATHPAVGLARAEQVYFRTLSQLLTRFSQFIDCRLAVIQACEELYPNIPAVADAARSAFTSVGIVGDEPTDVIEEVNENTGEEFIVAVRDDFFDDNSVYMFTTDGNQAFPLSQTLPKHPLSVTDDGTTAYFVGEDGHIHGIFLNPNNPQEQILSNNPEWDRVAISKDGLRLAAITQEIDTSIFVFNFDGPQITANRYRLFNPTFAEGVSTGDVLFADAMEWDFSGEFIMYDAFNELQASNGEDISYWDIGFLQAWDNSSNSFGSGNISKLFTQLPQGVAAGNAVFSKNSPLIIAYDFWDQRPNAQQEFLVYAANISTGDNQAVIFNSGFSNPNYSRTDGVMVFNTTTNDGFDTDIIGGINMQADRISPTNEDPFGIISNAKWPVWFTIGERDITTSNDPEVLASNFRLYPNPSTDVLTIEASNLIRIEQVQVFNLLGQMVEEAAIVNSSTSRLEIDLKDLESGIYTVQIQSAKGKSTHKIVKR